MLPAQTTEGSVVFRWLIVGMGMAGRVHAAAVDLSPRAQLVGVVSGQDSSFGVPAYRTLEEALSRSDADGVIITTPNHTHRDYCLQVIRAGLPVLCEKPVGVGSADARAIQAAGAEAKVPVGIVLNQRACRYARFVRDLIQDGALVPQSCSFSGEFGALSGWVMEPGKGGGLLRAIGIHYVDLLLWWFGMPERFEAELEGDPLDHRFDGRLQLPSGIDGSLHFLAAAGQGTTPVSCVIEGTNQHIEIVGGKFMSAAGVRPPPPEEEADERLWFGPGHGTLIDEASAALVAGRPFPMPLSVGMPTLELIEAMAADR